MPLFVGRYEVKLDPKGRVVLPAPFRALLGERAYVTKGDQSCLVVMPEESFEAKAAQMEEKEARGEISSAWLRTFYASAALVAPDSQGRVALQAELRDFAGITGTVIATGRGKWVELWDAERWHQVQAAGDAELAGSRS